MKITKGWKNLNDDMICRNFKFEIGKIYIQKGPLKMCSNGFHFHENPLDLYQYYSRDSGKVAEVTAYGKVVSEKDKSVCSKIKIERVLTEEEIRAVTNRKTNSGNRNSGYYNSGNRNSGYYNSGNRNSGSYNSGQYNSGQYNSGDYNSGDYNSGEHNSGHYNSGYRNSGRYNSGDYNSGCYNSGEHNSGHFNSGDYNSGCYNSGGYNSGYHNSGYYNSGDYNSGYYNSGHFNTDTPPTIRVFNQEIDRQIWDNAEKPDFIYFNDSWQKAKTRITKKDLRLLLALPNFNIDIFTEISGLTMAEMVRCEILFRKF